MTDAYDTMVVGGGLAGLTAATILGRAGRSVVLFDSRQKIGGRARSREEEGFILNEGPHALYRTGRATSVLRSLGIRPDGANPPLEGSQVVLGGRLHDLPVTPPALLGTKLLGGRSKLAAARILPYLQRGRDAKADGLSLAEWLDRRRAPDDLRQMVEMYVRLATYSNAPESLAATAALAQFKLAIDGVWYLHGGWQQLVDALVERARAVGVVFHHKVGIRSISRDGASWVGTSDVGDVAADDVVLAVSGPLTAARLAGRDVGWAERAGPPSRVSVLDVGAAAEPAHPIALSMDEPLYGSTHAPAARLAPDGHSLVSVMRYLRPDERPEKESARAELEGHVRAMGLDDWVNDRMLLSMTAAHGVPVARLTRPTGLELGAERIWACGDWAAGTGGANALLADAAVGSAADVAHAVLEATARAA